MGVHGTYCQLCALPLNHDHYVESGMMLKIYRSGQPDGGHTWEPGEAPFRFGPEHAWLCRGVALPHGEPGVVLRGTVSDGAFRDEALGRMELVFEGDDDGRAYHAWCYDAIGAPTSSRDAPVARGAHAWSSVGAYHAQLFEIATFARDGLAWMLEDPAGDTPNAARSRARIAALAADARRIGPRFTEPVPRSIADVLAQDRDWEARMFRNGARRELLRLRFAPRPELDVHTYPAMVWLVREYAGDAEGLPPPPLRDTRLAFEEQLKAAVEADGAAILVASMIGGTDDRLQYMMYARDADATMAAIAGVDPSIVADDYANEDDPQWNILFREVRPS